MNPEKLSHMRHTLAHVLAQAVLEEYPNAQLTLGPAIDNGFYYDVDFGETKIPESDLKKFQTGMRKNLKKWTEFTHKEVSKEEALALFAGNPYKEELINEIADKGEKITVYTCGGFTDLCRGGHLENPAAEISTDAFKLDRIAGAYWRGSEKNKMLTRIYGLAFESAEKLAEYLHVQEEAIKRDHKKLGKELDLFTFSELVGPGLPLWTPKGTLVRNLLDEYLWTIRSVHGYQRVEIPHITKKELYMTSGHWDKYKDDLFKITTREGHEFAMKPMNCPHHTQIYARKQWSYRELPQRYANTTTCYRDEQSGELSGLSRVRAFAQDDAHVFCQISQVKGEIQKIWDIVHTFYSTFDLHPYLRLSLRDPNHPEKYLGNQEHWDKAEAILKEVAAENNTTYFEGIGEAAFYAPKLDFMAKDSIGREWQLATIQLDVNMPERFDLYCINEKGVQERIVMIHAAIMGSLERFMSILIEHTAGNFPTWLAPVQVYILPVRENHEDLANEITKKLQEQGVRVDYLDSSDNLGKRIRKAKDGKVPYTIIIGDKDIEAGMITVETRPNSAKATLGEGQETGVQMKAEDFIEKITKEIKDRSL